MIITLRNQLFYLQGVTHFVLTCPSSPALHLDLLFLFLLDSHQLNESLLAKAQLWRSLWRLATGLDGTTLCGTWCHLDMKSGKGNRKKVHGIIPSPKESLSKLASWSIFNKLARDSPPFFQAAWMLSGTWSNLGFPTKLSEFLYPVTIWKIKPFSEK